MADIDITKIPKSIPQVREGNDVKYWTEIFPHGYKHKKDIITELKLDSIGKIKFHCQGDIIENPKKKNGFPICSCGKGAFQGKVWGSLDVGYELIYECKNCGNKMRVWTEE